MDKQVLIVLTVVIVLALLRVVVWAVMQRRRQAIPPGRHGPRCRPNPLSPEQRRRFATEWRLIEDRFPEDPVQALSEADRQVVEVMQARGYTVSSFEVNPEEVARDNPDLVENFRAARRIARASVQQSKDVLHQAMVRYRALFDDLVEVPVTEWQQAGS